MNKMTVRFGGDAGATVHDFTDVVRLYQDDTRAIFGGMKFSNGDASTGEFVIVDDASLIPNGDANNLQLYAHNEFCWIEDSPGYDAWLSIGRIATKSWGRADDNPMDVAREATVNWDDANMDLDGLTLTAKRVRPEETARARMQWVIEAWCQGDPRPSTNITFATETDGHLVGEGTGFDNVMDAFTYPKGTEILDIIRECNDRAGKRFGIVIHQDADGLGDHKCFEWVGESNTTLYKSDLSISDNLADVDHETVFLPEWRADAATTEDGTETLSGVVLTYGTDGDAAAFVEDPALVSKYEYWVKPFSFDRAQSATWATQRATNQLDAYSKEYAVHQPSIMIPARLHPKLRAGMCIDITADAAFGGELQGVTQTKRIAAIEWEPAGWKDDEPYLYANLQLDQPRRILTMPDPNHEIGPQPPSGNCTDLTGGNELDSFAEGNAVSSGSWNSNSNFHDISDGGEVVGNWHVGFGGVLTASNNFMYYCFTGTFTAGKRYTFGFWYKSDKVEDATCYFGASDTITTSVPGVFTTDHVTLSITPDGEWHHYEMEWIPDTTVVSDGSNATAVGVRWAVDATGSADGLVLADGGTLEECTDAEPPPASDDDVGDPGSTDGTCYSPCDHKHPAQTAAHTPITDAGGYYASDDVEGALQEAGPLVADAFKVKVTTNDTTPRYLKNKLVAGTNVTITEDNDGADETLTIDVAAGAPLSDDTPLVESGSGAAGVSTEASRSDHVHPADGGGGGGGGGSSPFTLNDATLYPLHGTYGDDFDGGSLNARWTRLNIDADTEDFAVGNTWMRSLRGGTVPSGGEGYYQTPASMPTYAELVFAGSFVGDTATGGSPVAGLFFVTSAGAGMGCWINTTSNIFRLQGLSSGAPSGSNSDIGINSPAGTIHWMRLIRVVGVSTVYFAQLSLDGNTWANQMFLVDTTAVTRIGFGRFVGNASLMSTLSIDRFNVVAKTLGNNLCVTPTSGTFTPTASSSFSGFSPASAFDGNMGTDWASNGYSAGQYIQGVWSVAQTVNTVVLTGRTSDVWANGYVEFSSGTRIPTGYMTDNRQNRVILRFPDESTTLIKVVSTSGGGTNPGFREIEAYNAT